MLSSISLSLLALYLSKTSFADNVPWSEFAKDGVKLWGQPIAGSGPYGFGGCKPEQATFLHNLFARIGLYLEHEIISEAQKGQASPAYNVLFSTNDVSLISGVITDIDKAPSKKSVDETTYAAIPFFMCGNTDNGDDAAAEAVAKCGDHPAAYFNGTSSVGTYRDHWLLCPAFWADGFPDFPTVETCPPVSNETYQFSRGTNPLQVTDNRLAVIIQTLARAYSANVGGKVYKGLNDIIVSDPVIQAANPNDYVYFASMVVAGCTDFPDYDAAISDQSALGVGNGGGRKHKWRRGVARPTTASAGGPTTDGQVINIDSYSATLQSSLDGIDKATQGKQ